jgi:integrase
MAACGSGRHYRCDLDVAHARVVISEAVTELPGGPVIATPKNHQRRELVVPAFVARLLAEHLSTLPDGADVFVFPGRQSHTATRQQSYHGFRRRFVQALEAAGLANVTPHDLRLRTRAGWPTRTASWSRPDVLGTRTQA